MVWSGIARSRPVLCRLRAGAARLAADRGGVTSLEYALMGACILVVIAAGVTGYTNGLSTAMNINFGKILAAM